MDNFDKWFTIIMASIILILFILWAIWLGIELDNMVKVLWKV